MSSRFWSRAARPLLALTCVATFAAAAHAQPSASLSLDQALLLAVDRSRHLTAQKSAAEAAREMAVAAGQRPDPTVRIGINNLPIDGPDRFSVARDFMTMRSIGFAQELTGAAKRRARAARFDREADSAEAGHDFELAALRRDTALAWLDRYYDEATRALLVRQRDEAKLAIEAAEIAYRTNRGTQADVFAARSAAAQIEDRIAQSERRIAVATTMLSRWVGDAGERSLGSPPPLDQTPVDPSALDARSAEQPELVTLAKREEVAAAEIAIARANQHADWTVEFMYSQRGSSFSNMVSLNFSIPFQWDQRNRQDRDVAARIAIAAQLRAEREEITRQRVAQARGWLQSWQSNRDRLARYDGTLIPLAAARVSAALVAYRGGSGALSTVLDARRMEIDLSIERVTLERETASLWSQLTYVIATNHERSTEPPAHPATER